MIDVAVIPEFHGKSYIELSPLPGEIDEAFSAEIWLLPRKPNGLIFYSGLLNELLGIVNGKDYYRS